MPDEDLSPVSKLLRMKRHEQPPPEYFENFLREFQERQRAEMLRRPVWRIALERIQAHFDDLIVFPAPGQLAYAGASVAVLVIAAVFTVDMLRHPGGEYPPAVASASEQPQARAPFQAAEVAPVRTVAAQSPESVPITPRSAPLRAYQFSLDSDIPFPDPFASQMSAASMAGQTPRSIPAQTIRQYPRYILDTRPASYEPPHSF